MEEIGVVKSIDGVNARVIMGKRSGCCDHCEKETCDITDNGVDSELLAAFGGLLAFFTSLIFVKILSGRMNRKTEYQSIIEEILE